MLPSRNDTLPLTTSLKTTSGLSRKATEQSLLSEAGNKVDTPGKLDYQVVNQVQEALPLMKAPKQTESVIPQSNNVVPNTPKSQQLPLGNASLDPTRVALLLETRPSSKIPSLLSHFISVLPVEWTFRFVGSRASLALVSASASLQRFIGSGKLVITELPSEYPIYDSEALSATLCNLTFYRDFLAPAEWLFFFQTDSMVCSASTISLNDWVDKEYTWVGSPWHENISFGGNGGLSLRHLPPIIKLLEQQERVADDLWEDRWLTDRLGVTDAAHMPGPEITRYFGVESVWTEQPFGYHLTSGGSFEHLLQHIWGNETRLGMILDYCPEVKLILDMELSPDMQTARELAEQKLTAGLRGNYEVGDGHNETIVLKSEVVTLL